MSILDWLMVISAGIIGAIVFLVLLIIIAIVRWWMSRIDRKDESQIV